MLPAADYYIDLHSGDDYEQLTPYVYYAGRADREVSAMSRRMAEQVDVPYMVKSDVASGGAYNYAASQGIPSILIERGGMGGWNNEEVRSTRRDVRNILCHLGIYRGTERLPDLLSAGGDGRLLSGRFPRRPLVSVPQAGRYDPQRRKAGRGPGLSGKYKRNQHSGVWRRDPLSDGKSSGDGRQSHDRLRKSGQSL